MKVEKTTLWLYRKVVDEIIEIVGKQGLSEFAREAMARELERRRAEKAAEKDKSAQSPSTPT